jgi:hypothetical protein
LLYPAIPFRMRTIIYVDGFNLYYRMLATRPALKWLDLKALAGRLASASRRASSLSANVAASAA